MSEERQDYGVSRAAGKADVSAIRDGANPILPWRKVPSARAYGYGVALGLVVSCLALAFLSGERLDRRPALRASLPSTLPFQALLDSVRQKGLAMDVIDGGIRLYEDTSIGIDVRAPANMPVPVFLVARGTPARGVYPLVSLTVDRRFVAGVFVASDTWGLFRILAPVSGGRHRVDLAFINDAFFYPEDRNLDLRSVSVGMPPPDAAAYIRWRAPCRMAPDRLSERVFVEGDRTGVSVLNHGKLGDDIFFEKAGSYAVRILMGQPRRATCSSRLRVEWEGTVVTNCVLRSATATVYVARVKAETGLMHLTLVNASPFLRRPAEADIRVVEIEIGDADPDSEVQY